MCRDSVSCVLTIILLVTLVMGVSGDESCTFVKTWPYEGGVSTMPPDIAVDASGMVYVTDPGNSRVLQYLSDGTRTSYREYNDTESGVIVLPVGITVDAAHTVYITDRKNSTIIKQTPFKKEIWGSEGTGNRQFDHPAGIAVDSAGTVYVVDTGNNRVQKIHSSGNYLLQWGSYGTARGAFNEPGNIAIDARDHVYVTDPGNSRIQKFTPDGIALTAWGSRGTGAGQFLSPSGIAVDSWGDVYVTDQTPRIQKFSPIGEYFTTCNTSGTAYDVAFGPSGEVYVIMQSGSSWEIGEYRFTSAIPKETPVKRSTFSVVVPQTPLGTSTPYATATVQDTPFPQQPGLNETNLTIAPVVPLVNSSAPHLAEPAANVTAISKPGTQDNEKGRLSPAYTDIFDRINGFLISVFGVKIPFSA